MLPVKDEATINRSIHLFFWVAKTSWRFLCMGIPTENPKLNSLIQFLRSVWCHGAMVPCGWVNLRNPISGFLLPPFRSKNISLQSPLPGWCRSSPGRWRVMGMSWQSRTSWLLEGQRLRLLRPKWAWRSTSRPTRRFGERQRRSAVEKREIMGIGEISIFRIDGKNAEMWLTKHFFCACNCFVSQKTCNFTWNFQQFVPQNYLL